MRKLFPLLCLLLLLACEKEETAELLPIDSALRLEVAETTESGVPQAILHISTLKEYPCTGYTILAENRAGEFTFTILFDGIQSPAAGCLTALNPARGIFPLGQLQKGVYHLTLSHRASTFIGALEVTENEYILEFPAEQGLIIPKPRVQR